MSERKWTKAQLEAIEFSGKNLILSAAAGSGKTATLTERIIRLLKDPQKGALLSRMLIVTFTTAAAGELKSRIADALSTAIANDPKNASLTRQLASLESAHISTIDSFFKSELSPYFSSIGMPPDFGILDEAQAQVLRKEAMRETIAAHFEGRAKADTRAFCALADSISTQRNEEDLCDSLLSICANLLSYDISSEALNKRADALEDCSDDFFKSEYCTTLKEYLCGLSVHYKNRFSHLANVLSIDPDTEKYCPEAMRLSDICDGISLITGKTYTEAKVFLSDVEFPRLSPIKRGKTSDDYDLFKETRNAFKEEITSLRADFFSQDEGSVRDAMIKTASHVRTLSLVNEHFLSVYAREKRDRGEADFSDLAQFARRIFVSPDGTPTKAAVETGKKFDYIFIDEYQDTNPVQDAIFSAISCHAGRFMVGDVKQSIYGFRGSRPQLFTDYREKFESGDEGHAIFMSENFRSDRCVIDFSNVVSRYIFADGNTPFEKEDELICSKQGGDSDNLCEVILIEKEPDCDTDPVLTEEECVAARISELLHDGKLSNGEPIRKKDIAILLRSGTNADNYVRALAERGISANNSASEEFFAYGEVLLVLCLLNTADNPLRDIYLAGAMKSPLFDFTLDDLINIRRTSDVPLWYSLCDYCLDGTDESLRNKCAKFKDTVQSWREAAKELYADEMLRLIVADTDLRKYGGDGIRSNADVIRSLKVLSEHASAISKRGGTLHELISHLNSVIERKDKTASFSDPDSVSILTVHKSKGLEYPVCFLCEAAKKFNVRDTAEKLLFDKSGKIAMKLYDDGGLVRCDNPLRRGVAMQMNADSIEEEARVLYVAMTRARERLIVTCKVKNAAERISRATARSVFPLDRHEVTSGSTYGDWIIDALQRKGDGSFFVYKKGTDITGHYTSESCDSKKTDGDLLSFFEKSLDFSYDKEYLWNIPAKLSVSVLKPDLLGGDEEKAYFDSPALVSMPDDPPTPSFLSEKKAEDGAAMGTATHVFMQFCDYERLQREGCRAELSRLVENQFMLPADADLVRMAEIDTFRESDLFQRLLRAKKILRERRFNTLLPAADFTADPLLSEKLREDGVCITVQGVVDCIFIDENDKAVLVDYKTDRLTKKEISDESLAQKKLLARHSRQLTLYEKVCSQMLGIPFDEVCIYSLPLGKTISVK